MAGMATVLVTSSSHAALLGVYEFTGNSVNATQVVTGLSFGTFTRGPGAASETGSNNFVSSSFSGSNLGQAITNNDYVSFFVLTPATGYTYSVQQFGYDWAVDSGGSPQAHLLSSITTFTAGASLGSLVKDSTNQVMNIGPAATFSNLSNSSEFRIYVFGSSNNNKQTAFDNIKLFGDVQALASLSATVTDAPPSRVLKGQSAQIKIQTTNNAGGNGTTTAQALNYSLGLSGANGLGLLSNSATGVPRNDVREHLIAVNTSTPGRKTGQLNAASTNAYQQNLPTLPDVDVLEHARGKFVGLGGAGTADLSLDGESLTIDFGAVNQGDSTPISFFDVFADLMTLDPDFTAKLDLDSILGLGDTQVLQLLSGETSFSNVAAGDGRSYSAGLNTSVLGAFEATYQFLLSDEDLPGAEDQTLTLTLMGMVIPEPSTIGLLVLGTTLLCLRTPNKR